MQNSELKPVFDNSPKKSFSRNEFGLLEVNYVFNDDSTVNWKSMIPPQYLYVNPDMKRRDKLEKKYGKTYSEINPVEDKVEDIDLIQLLGAAKYLLRLRGYKSLRYVIKESTEHYASVSCSIVFNGNYETQMQDVEFSENACAHPGNTNGFGQKYLLEMATNRAFARCVRNFLNINIVSKEELGADTSSDGLATDNPNAAISPHAVLATKLKERGFDLTSLKKSIKKYPDLGLDSDTITKLEDIPVSKVWNLISKIQEKEKK